jgi:hypothetical protein
MLELKKNTLEWIVTKQRQGRVGNYEFFADMASNAIRDKI